MSSFLTLQQNRKKSRTRLTSTWLPVANKERLNMPVIVELVAREQPEHHLRECFMERVRYYREQSLTLPKASDPHYY